MSALSDTLARPLFPWLHDDWQALATQIAQQRLPHALLLSSPAGYGKRHFAQALAQKLLCQRASEFGCGNCRDCQQFAAASHPDYHVIEAEAGRAIRIDQIRALQDFIPYSSHAGGYRIVVLVGAEQMNANAANSLLKTLEEPPPGRLLILLSQAPSRLAPTILSRCQQRRLQRPSAALATTWLCEQTDPALDRGAATELLQLARYAPLNALALANSDAPQKRAALFASYQQLFRQRKTAAAALPQASTWLDGDAVRHLGWLHSWLRDALRLRLAGPTLAADCLDNPDLQPALAELAAHLPGTQWHQLLQMAQHLLNISTTAPQINLELQLDVFFQAHSAHLDG